MLATTKIIYIILYIVIVAHRTRTEPKQWVTQSPARPGGGSFKKKKHIEPIEMKRLCFDATRLLEQTAGSMTTFFRTFLSKFVLII